MAGKARVNSRQKGKRIERDAVRYLRGIGFSDARRTQQFRGSHISGDIECPDSLPNTHVEVKGDQGVFPGSVAWKAAIEQARDDSGQKPWAVLHKRKREWWQLTIHGQNPHLPVTVVGDENIRTALYWLNSLEG